MANNTLAAAELAVFLGFAGWLFYSQRRSSRPSGTPTTPPRDDAAPPAD